MFTRIRSVGRRWNSQKARSVSQKLGAGERPLRHRGEGPPAARLIGLLFSLKYRIAYRMANTRPRNPPLYKLVAIPDGHMASFFRAARSS